MNLAWRKTKQIAWNDFFQVEKTRFVTLKITPDSGVRNYRTEDIAKTIAEQFRLPIDRIHKAGKMAFRYIEQERAAFEIAFEGGAVRFFLSVPEQIAPLMKRRIMSVWDGATVEELPRSSPYFYKENAVVYEVSYRRHDMYSLHTDAKDNLPLGSMLEAGRLIGDKERARIVALFDPIHQLTYQNDMQEAWRKLREGHTPKKLNSGFREYARIGAIGIAMMMREIVDAFSSLISGDGESLYKDKSVDPEASEFAIANLSPSTKRKQSAPGVKTYLWVLAESESKARADVIARTMVAGFNDLAADNELVASMAKNRKRDEILASISQRRPPRIRVNYNLMSTAEIGKIIQLPGRELQDKYAEIEHSSHQEVEVNSKLTKGGMKLGECTFKGTRKQVFMPTKDWDELCAPDIVIAGMGQGKTRGYAANKIIQAIENGFGALAIDPAKGEIGDEVEMALPPDKVERINLAKTIFSLDFCEIGYAERRSNRLANTILSFFASAMGVDETGGQTSRFLKAAVMGMQSGKLSEIMRIFEDASYRDKVIKQMRDGMHKSTLAQFHNESEGRQRQILSPIYNRLDSILGDEFLEQCLESDDSLDMVEIIRKKKAIILDVPKRDLGPEGVDIVVNLLMTKLDLAMTFRPEEELFPFFVLIDEPHQYAKAQHIWKSACVESRKWRIGYTFLFHEWLQIDRDLRRIVKSALPHYHFYPTSKDIWRDVLEEIYPHTLEGALRLERFHAINVIRSGGESITPFIAKMTPPPSAG